VNGTGERDDVCLAAPLFEHLLDDGGGLARKENLFAML